MKHVLSTYHAQWQDALRRIREDEQKRKQLTLCSAEDEVGGFLAEGQKVVDDTLHHPRQVKPREKKRPSIPAGI